MEKKKIFKVKVIDVFVDDVVEFYLDCDLDKVVSLLSDFIFTKVLALKYFALRRY